MHVFEFLTDPSLQLPQKRKSDDFLQHVRDAFCGFQQRIKQLSEPSELVSRIKNHTNEIEEFCNAAIRVVELTFAGRPSEAFANFKSAIEPIKDCLDQLKIESLSPTDLRFLFRLRRHQSPSLTPEEMFHIPFEKRHLVATQRYSIPGLPCLYLGGSLFTCWEEMGRPPFHELHASAFWLKATQKVTLLDLSNRPSRLKRFINAESTDSALLPVRALVVNSIVLWPFTMMCSIVVKHKESPYKPEYIFPQAVLQWLTDEQKYDGVCYFSTHVEPVAKNPLDTCNLVFPSREIKPEGRCSRLRDLFKMTAPHGWQLLSAVNLSNVEEIHLQSQFDFEFIDGRKESYYRTEFGKVQSKLCFLAKDIFSKNSDGLTELGDVAE